MVARLDKLTNLSSSIRAEVSSPESSKKETTQLGFVGMVCVGVRAAFLRELENKASRPLQIFWANSFSPFPKKWKRRH
jgi:hypothetical protein